MVDINDYNFKDYQGILSASPVLSSGMTLFHEVYYPILILELSMEEETFEDLEAVQYHVIEALMHLPLYGEDIPEQIARAYGLSPQYISKLLKLFQAYGYINEKYQITALGKEAHEKEKKIRRGHTIQLFHYDLLNGNLLKLSDNFDKHMVKKAKNVNRKAIIIPSYETETDKQSFCNYVTRLSGNDFIKHNRDILNVNIRAIDDAKCVDRDFVKGYLICHNAISIPLFYTKYFDLTQKFDSRTVWKPLVVGSAKEGAYLQQKNVPIAKNLYVSNTRYVASQLEEREAKKLEKENQKMRQQMQTDDDDLDWTLE